MPATKFLMLFWHEISKEISESDLEIFDSEFGKSVNRVSKSSTPKESGWRTEKKERRRERKFSLNCWKAKKKDVSSSINAEQICLNLLLWILCLLLKSQNTYTPTHTRKNSEWLNSKLCWSVKPNKIKKSLKPSISSLG
jgi:hypothetical protein